MNKYKILLFLLNFFMLTVGLHAQTLKAFLNAGDHAFNEKKYNEAAAFYTKALEFETDDIAINMKMAESLRMTKDYQRAAAWYGKVVLADKENHYPQALFRFGEMKKYLASYDEAGRIFERYVAANPKDTSYSGIKSKREITDCKTAINISKQPPLATVTNAGAPVNTTFSEFGASMIGDTTLYFSSLRYLYEQKSENKAPYFVSRILKANNLTEKNIQPVPLGILINEAATHNCNTAFSPDYKIMIFSRCAEDENFSLDCKLYMCRLEQGKWGKPALLPSIINFESYTATQPAIKANGADGYTLFFVSDRPGGQGMMDIWKSDLTSAGEFLPPVNLGPTINDFDDEMTPYYDTPNNILYFSSYSHPGLGGMDIFKSEWTNETFTSPVNLGPAINTSYNDVYYTKNRDGKSGTLSSNRYGSISGINKTCCYDIYYYKNIIPIIDSVALAISDTSPLILKNSTIEDITLLTSRTYYDKFLPLQLYFENDEPDKRSNGITTRSDYETLYQQYINQIDLYKENYSLKLIGESKINASEEVANFFNKDVVASHNLLNEFCSKLEKALKLGVKAELEIRGRTSPLAKDAYNKNLSSRRISSLVNYMKIYNNGSLVPYFIDNSIRVTEVAAGESLANNKISDALTDKRNSVYSPKAAVERRIELINIKLVAPTNEK